MAEPFYHFYKLKNLFVEKNNFLFYEENRTFVYPQKKERGPEKDPPSKLNLPSISENFLNYNYINIKT